MSARTWRRRVLAGGALLLAGIWGCASDPVGAGPSIAASYVLTDVLPPGPLADSAGGSVAILNGRLDLGAAAPEPYVYTPGGAIARSCVHDIPDGAWVDAANIVHLPDGSTYALPRCGTGSYTLLLTLQHVAADGSSRIVPDSSVGLYTWDRETSTGDGILTLVDARMVGSIAFGGGGPVISLDTPHLLLSTSRFPPLTYVFSRPMPH